LCHLGEFNHSPAFWSLVEKTIPEHKEIRKALRSHVL
jgi:predicted metal-dependent hydrolase